MKSILILFAVFAIVSCTLNSQKPERAKIAHGLNEEKSLQREDSDLNNIKILDTIVGYWKTDFDTIIETQSFNLDNTKLAVEVKTFCLNDSSIIRTNQVNDSTVYKDVYHDYVSDLTFKKGEKTLIHRTINKRSFRDSLAPEFFQYSVLRSVTNISIRSNRIYLTATLNVPDTAWLIETEFALFFRTNKKGQMDFWGFKNVGL